MLNGITKGWKTTEFWMSLGAMVLPYAAQFIGALPANSTPAIVGTAAIAAIYAMQRGGVKKKGLEGAAVAAAAVIAQKVPVVSADLNKVATAISKAEAVLPVLVSVAGLVTPSVSPSLAALAGHLADARNALAAVQHAAAVPLPAIEVAAVPAPGAGPETMAQEVVERTAQLEGKA